MVLVSALCWPIVAGLLLSFACEQCCRPKPLMPWHRPLVTTLIHVGTWLLIVAMTLVLVQRPWFAVSLSLAVQILVLLVHQAKFHSLREVFVFQDFDYFTDAIKHPRLYLPYFGVARLLMTVLGIGAAIGVGLMLEASLLAQWSWLSFIASCVLMAIAGVGLVSFGLRYCPAATYQPDTDLCQLGQIAFFWLYWHAEQHTVIDAQHSAFATSTPAKSKPQSPDIIVVQSESFFDARVLTSAIHVEVLQHFDQIKTHALQHGRLQVPAWGANTVRTECGFLTGLTPEQLGVHRFNPYRFMAQHTVPNMVSYLKAMGYFTVCLHPYPASFYLRDQVMPRLGFDCFLDNAAFEQYPKTGQYIGDSAVAEQITTLLQERGGHHTKPLFIFAITMENHGPLHLEKANTADEARFYRTVPPACDDLTVYLSHLYNADQMIRSLQQTLQNQARDGVLCWYGDHVPIMPAVYDNLGEPDGWTEYFIWHSGLQAQAQQAQPIAIYELAPMLLRSCHLL
jgi:phosphoglycerol transferase MdoB-like AlkP superfamily enzyme